MNDHHTTGRPHKKPQKEGWQSIASSVAILLAAPLVALLLTAFVFQSYQVDGPSMQSTLQPNDRLIVWKLPRTWAKITGHQYVPKRGDVVIFSSASPDFAETPGRQLIKRVVGLPGERVVVKNGTVTVYNKEHPEGFQPDRTLPYGNVIGTTVGEEADYTIPNDELFVLGDNRDNSLDSRSFGPIQTKEVVGKLVLRLFPFSDMKRF
jgi:signal peptidase I